MNLAIEVCAYLSCLLKKGQISIALVMYEIRLYLMFTEVETSVFSVGTRKPIKTDPLKMALILDKK